MSVRAFSESYPCARRRLQDGEIVIPTYKYRGLKGWWGQGTPLGHPVPLWYFYFPKHGKPGSAIGAVQKVLGSPVTINGCSDEEVYFWCPETAARALMASGPRWCRVRRKKAVHPHTG